MRLTLTALLACAMTMCMAEKINFCSDWQLHYPPQSIEHPGQTIGVTLPRAWNEDYSYRVTIADLPNDTCRYSKTFQAPTEWQGKRVLIEFEGARQSAEVWLNGQRLGLHQNGVMAFGFDLTPYLKYGQTNLLEVLTDNDWAYKERNADGTPLEIGDAQETSDGNGLPNNKLQPNTFQWNNKNFNQNMGGLPKRVWLHVKEAVYQTLPLYSNLGTTGVYIYGTDHDIKGHKVTCNVESQVINSTDRPQRVSYEVEVLDADGKRVAKFGGSSATIAAGDTITLKARKRLSDIHFWSWGYGYLYTVKTTVRAAGMAIPDVVSTRTGFRKTQFGEGLFYLNDRCLMVHGYAQRTSNEWPSVGLDVPEWLSDYTNDLMVQSGGNLVRWMHVTPSKQDIESCDRVGLIEAMPAGDAEKDVVGRHWTQRTQLMRDAIIYNRNNPSIIFYECGNESISREHMIEMKAIRDQYDPMGGRAIGSREMLDINEAEYGGEMLYINKSGKHPMWAMEYCRDEGYRMYWDNYSYPYHQHGAGPYYRKAPAEIYNQNQDMLTLEQVRRWHDYYVVRPGMGRRVSSGGVKIVFSDTNTHGRSEMNYRTSGVVDAMRIEKDPFYAHQVMWNSWVDIEHSATHIVGHWNYPDGVVKPVYVISTSPIVELLVNGECVGRSEKAESTFIHTFENVAYQPGEIRAVAYAADGVTIESEARHETVGQPHHLQLTLMENPQGGMQADGADLALIQVEVVDEQGRRCPVDNRFIDWKLQGPAEWRGGMGKSPDGDNYILATRLPVEAGVSRVLVRSTTQAGKVSLTARAQGLADATLTWQSHQPSTEAALLPCRLSRGETPAGASYTDKKRTIEIASATSGSNAEEASKSFDDNELSEWKNDGRLSTAWITYTLKEESAIEEINLKLTGWRQRSYPLEVYADDQLVWKGYTEKSLGYVSLFIDHPVKAKTYTIRQTGSAKDKDAFGQITEIAGGPAAELDLYKTPNSDQVKGELRIVEIDFLRNIE